MKFKKAFDRVAQLYGRDALYLQRLPEAFINIDIIGKNGLPEVGIFNTAYLNYEYKNRFPYCFRYTIQLLPLYLDATGLPLDMETREMHYQEKVFMKDVTLLVASYFIGHVFNDGCIHFWWYLRDPERVRAHFIEEINRADITRISSFQITYDPHWKQVMPYLSM